MRNVFIKTLGCKVNQFESASFRQGLEEQGHVIVADETLADVIIINTCAVTANAGAQSRQMIRKSLRKNPEAKIVITGCYAEIGEHELAGESLLQERGFTLIGNCKKDRLVETITENKDPLRLMGDIHTAVNICRLPVKSFAKRTRVYLRVQDGCDSYCSYCIVPYTRGPSRSLPAVEVVEQAKILAAAGHKEIVLTGIHLGYYGNDLSPETEIAQLLDQLIEATPKTRYRISSLEPSEISVDLLTKIATSTNLQPHLHIPLQSGSDRILEKMNRHYTTNDFSLLVHRIKKLIPDCGIGIDILAGFPGESDILFEQSIDFLEGLDITYLHAFPYSLRPGTAAAQFTNHVPQKIKDQRVKRLLQLGRKKQKTFAKSQIGNTRQVLVEGRRDEKGRLRGISDNYIDVRFAGPDTLFRQPVKVMLEGGSDTMYGTLVNDHEDRNHRHW